MKGLFGLVALVITMGLIIYVVSLQIDRFQSDTNGGTNRVQTNTGSMYVTEPESIFDTVDMADDAARALEVRNRIPDNLLQ